MSNSDITQAGGFGGMMATAAAAILPAGATAEERADPAAPRAAYSVDVRRGERSTRVNAAWTEFPPDARYLDLGSMLADASARTYASTEAVFDPEGLRFEALPGNGLGLRPEGGRELWMPNAHAFGQLCQRVGAPAQFVRELPSGLAAQVMAERLARRGRELADGGHLKALLTADGELTLRAVTGANYGRIPDDHVIEQVMRFAGQGNGDTRWKVPGCIDWLRSMYNPEVEVSKESTTLYWTPAKLFLFLVDDRNPIRVGTLANGEPDYVFRGVLIENSETGDGSLRITVFFLRGVCANRCLWGLEGEHTFRIRHSRMAPERFIGEAAPKLLEYADASAQPMLAGIERAKELVLAADDEEAVEFLTGRKARLDLTEAAARRVLDTHLREEGRPARSGWDFLQGVTAVARKMERQEARLELEEKAGALMGRLVH